MGAWGGLAALYARDAHGRAEGDWAATSLAVCASLTQLTLQKGEPPASAVGCHATGMSARHRVYPVAGGKYVYGQARSRSPSPSPIPSPNPSPNPNPSPSSTAPRSSSNPNPNPNVSSRPGARGLRRRPAARHPGHDGRRRRGGALREAARRARRAVQRGQGDRRALLG